MGRELVAGFEGKEGIRLVGNARKRCWLESYVVVTK